MNQTTKTEDETMSQKPKIVFACKADGITYYIEQAHKNRFLLTKSHEPDIPTRSFVSYFSALEFLVKEFALKIDLLV